MKPLATSPRGARRARAFTLLELLLVIAILGTLAALSLPAMRNLRRSQGVTTAERQLLDDLAFARLRAMSDRSDVFVVFVPPVGMPESGGPPFPYFSTLTPPEKTNVTRLLDNQCSAYALFAARRVGDQPGRPTPRYLTDWRSLPEGLFIATNKFTNLVLNDVAPFEWIALPFPFADSPARFMPCIHYDPQGRLVSGRDEVLPLARGGVFKQESGGNPARPRVDENPPLNSILASNHIRIDWLTGRGRVEKQQLP